MIMCLPDVPYDRRIALAGAPRSMRRHSRSGPPSLLHWRSFRRRASSHGSRGLQSFADASTEDIRLASDVVVEGRCEVALKEWLTFGATAALSPARDWRWESGR